MMTATASRLPGDVAFWDEFLAAVRPRLGETTKFTREEPLAAKTTIRIGGAARLYAEPNNRR